MTLVSGTIFTVWMALADIPYLMEYVVPDILKSICFSMVVKRGKILGTEI
jgi:hypothetical protein